MHSRVFNVVSVQSRLILEELLKLLLNIVSHWLPAVHTISKFCIITIITTTTIIIIPVIITCLLQNGKIF